MFYNGDFLHFLPTILLYFSSTSLSCTLITVNKPTACVSLPLVSLLISFLPFRCFPEGSAVTHCILLYSCWDKLGITASFFVCRWIVGDTAPAHLARCRLMAGRSNKNTSLLQEMLQSLFQTRSCTQKSGNENARSDFYRRTLSPLTGLAVQPKWKSMQPTHSIATGGKAIQN